MKACSGPIGDQYFWSALHAMFSPLPGCALYENKYTESGTAVKADADTASPKPSRDMPNLFFIFGCFIVN